MHAGCTVMRSEVTFFSLDLVIIIEVFFFIIIKEFFIE